MGCYLVHLKEGTSWTLESLKAYAILTEDAQAIKERLARDVVKYNFYGDQMSVIEAWARMIGTLFNCNNK